MKGSKGITMKQTDIPATGRTSPRMSARINLRLPLGWHLRLRREAFRRQMDVSDVAREIIGKAIRQNNDLSGRR
jgi:hypothetical protein